VSPPAPQPVGDCVYSEGTCARPQPCTRRCLAEAKQDAGDTDDAGEDPNRKAGALVVTFPWNLPLDSAARSCHSDSPRSDPQQCSGSVIGEVALSIQGGVGDASTHSEKRTVMRVEDDRGRQQEARYWSARTPLGDLEEMVHRLGKPEVIEVMQEYRESLLWRFERVMADLQEILDQVRADQQTKG
jgi:hypothetical protein